VPGIITFFLTIKVNLIINSSLVRKGICFSKDHDMHKIVVALLWLLPFGSFRELFGKQHISSTTKREYNMAENIMRRKVW
jgi:fructose-1,6-bisphosphatase